MFGYNIRKLPESTAESLRLLSHNICYDTFEEGHLESHGVTRADVNWVYHLGRFKTAAHMVGLLCGSPC